MGEQIQKKGGKAVRLDGLKNWGESPCQLVCALDGVTFTLFTSNVLQ